MPKTRIGLSFSDGDLERIAQLQVALGTRNRTETISVAVQLALALRTDPVGSLAAAGVRFESAINIELSDGKVLVRAPTWNKEFPMSARVIITKNNRIHCQGCAKTMSAEYKEQDPAPCGCAWVWNEETQLLEAVPSRK